MEVFITRHDRQRLGQDPNKVMKAVLKVPEARQRLEAGHTLTTPHFQISPIEDAVLVEEVRK